MKGAKLISFRLLRFSIFKQCTFRLVVTPVWVVISAMLSGGWGMGGICLASTGIFGGTLDQSYNPEFTSGYSSYSIYEGLSKAQTFRVGTSGRLTEVDLLVCKNAFTQEELDQITYDLILSVVTTTSSGAPSTSTLGTVLIAPSEVPTPYFPPQFVAVDMRTSGIQVEAGQLLALQLSTFQPGPSQPGDPPPPCYGFITLPEDGYAAGSGWNKKDPYAWGEESFDFGFQTYVEPVPEPGTLGLCALGMCVWVFHRRKGGNCWSHG